MDHDLPMTGVIAMTVQSEPYPVVQMLIERFADWLKHRRELNEIRQMNRTDFNRIANDLKLSPDDLDELVRHGQGADQLPRLLENLGLNEDDLVRAAPLMVRDMQRVCALCRHKAQCDHELIAGTADENYQDYCPNASTIEGLAGPAKH
jgi:uncharacterized protein YjiS (DUF1127 family)